MKYEARVAQQVERPIRNRLVGGWIPLAGSILALALFAAGCATKGGPITVPDCVLDGSGCLPERPPARPNPDTPPPVADAHVPVCANGNVSECWHHPPDIGWVFNCKDGAPTVSGPKQCPAAPSGRKPPQGAWHPLPPALPPAHVVAAVNAAAQKAGKCLEGPPSRCVVGPGYPTVSREQEHEASIDFGRAVCAELPTGYICGFHDEANPGDELAIAESAAGPFHGIKIATLGGQIVVAWVAMPREACFGGADPSGEDKNIHPPKIGCPGVGGGSYRGDWTTGAAPRPPDRPADPPAGDATTCDADAPATTGYRISGRPLPRDPAAQIYLCAIPTAQAPEWCRVRFADNRQWGTCSYYPEGHPRRDDCLHTIGRPVFFGAVTVRENNPLCGDAPLGAAITICAAASCGDVRFPSTCSVCENWTARATQ